MPTLGVFAAIIDDDRRILCGRMNYGTRAWTTPGGRVDYGESLLGALKREVVAGIMRIVPDRPDE
jgi:ADP-ribose pyrophosphatase YjhB (NUDIX family)